MKSALFACIILMTGASLTIDTMAGKAQKQPLAMEPKAKLAKAGKGSCKSGRFLVLDKPLLRFSGADAACARVGKKLATIDAVFGGSDPTVMDAAKAAILKCVGSDYQVWYDTTITKNDKPSTCTAFMVTLGPKDGPATSRKQSENNVIILPTTVLGGCNVKLPTLCM